MKTQKKVSIILPAILILFFIPVKAQFVQQGRKLVGTGVTSTANQGYSVSLSADGNTAIIGGDYDNYGRGAAWVFTRNGSDWIQQGGKLVGTGYVGSPVYEGWSVSISGDGNTAIVGGIDDSNGIGAAWVFSRSGGVWTQQGSKLVGTGYVGKTVWQGRSVSLSADGNTAIVGGPYDSIGVGAAWVYIRTGDVWTQQGSKLIGTGAIGHAVQGYSVSLSADGNTALVGGDVDNAGVGAAWVFTRTGGVWTQQGSKLVGTGYVGNPVAQGVSVSLSADGNTAIVGGYGDNNWAGAAWIFTQSGGVWTQQGNKLVGTGGWNIANQGYSVSLSGDGSIALVSGPQDSGLVGAVWVYMRGAGGWTQQGGKLIGTGAVGPAEQGSSVSISADGNTAIVGGYHDSLYTGASWVYTSLRTTQIDLADGWNMVSIPLLVNECTTSALFPAAISRAFTYEGKYVPYTSLKNGTGYWLKFSEGQSTPVTGHLRTLDTVPVKSGWNMIGGLSTTEPTTNVVGIPPGIVTGNFFGYSDNYFITDSIAPGKAYWVRVNQDGELIFLSSASANTLAKNRIRIVPTEELPPAPPDGNELRRKPVPTSYVLEQNYPNPFNPTTVITYTLPEQAFVRLDVYNLLGQEVARLVNRVQNAGARSVEFDARKIPSGVYFYKVTAGSFTAMKKMVLMK